MANAIAAFSSTAAMTLRNVVAKRTSSSDVNEETTRISSIKPSFAKSGRDRSGIEQGAFHAWRPARGAGARLAVDSARPSSIFVRFRSAGVKAPASQTTGMEVCLQGNFAEIAGTGRQQLPR